MPREKQTRIPTFFSQIVQTPEGHVRNDYENGRLMESYLVVFLGGDARVMKQWKRREEATKPLRGI